MSDIYIIFYTDQSCIDEDRSWVEEIYFTDKNKAIKHLKDKGYVHELDDMYVMLWTEAEIILLNKQEEK
ncbi:hypothetical protein PZB81_08935 [Staphylococcus epidermidis]|uniref:hypothetical protein n=1 Tax=Staphylococcus epidermidis TaxID=1282 RepID=UPI00026C0D1E|nr:hypothetical protein [Staphylococcus epidermidis]EJD81233.1 hypothetical protein HMPREF9995_01695 [Staphylococcus epidermidis NIHLM095]EJD84214.1 hypothetical protein HMPREF9993_00452 [Staphylococcus epidermidis NIHLM087]QNL84813.1 hypothetical protein ATM22_08830 [Staphylococcus epidermidis]WEE07872.1 hypothetical protein PZB81_08935 [Staphylococcus epidermidis]